MAPLLDFCTAGPFLLLLVVVVSLTVGVFWRAS